MHVIREEGPRLVGGGSPLLAVTAPVCIPTSPFFCRESRVMFLFRSILFLHTGVVARCALL